MKTIAYLGEEEAVAGGHCAIFIHKQNPKYLSYLLNGSYDIIKQKNKLARGVKVIELSTSDMEKIKIPLPSIIIQNQIVKILDRFRELIEQSGLLPEEIKKKDKNSMSIIEKKY